MADEAGIAAILGEHVLHLAGPAIISWLIGCGAAFSLIQSIKAARRDCRARKLPKSLIRAIAFILAALFSFLPARVFFGMAPEVACLHSILAGTLYPLVIYIVMEWARRKQPALYARLRSTRAKDFNPDDSGSFFW